MSETLRYPEARREIVRESIGGIEIEDPYRWLEPDTAEATAWGDAQTALSIDYIRSWEHFDTVREQLAESGFLFNSQSYYGPVRCGDQWVHVVNRRGAYLQLMLADEPFGRGEVIYDPDILADPEPRKLDAFVPSPDGRYIAVNLRQEGRGRDHSGNGPGLLSVWRIIDVATGESSVIGRNFAAWLPDSAYFSIARHADSVAVFRDRPADEPSTEPELAGAAGIVQLSADGRHAALLDPTVETRGGTVGAGITHVMDENGWRPFNTAIAGRCQGTFLGDAYIAIVLEGSPKGRVVSIPIKTPENRSTWRELIAEGERVIRFLSVVRDQIVLGLADDSGIELAVHDSNGRLESVVPLPPGQIPTGAWVSLGHDAIRPCPGGFYFMHNAAFAELPSFYIYDTCSRTVTHFPAPVKSLGPLTVTVLDGYHGGADGAQLPIRLVHRPDVDLSEPRPLILHGYGNIGLCFYEPPAWFTPFLDAGGVYAWVALRGGGERGDEWRNAGRGVHKGRSALDFGGAAEYLIEQGIADRDRIAGFGFSGGAFLTGITLGWLGRQLRPDLFKVLVGIGGCYDYFTYARVAGVFADEWGDPAGDPVNAEALASWSSYQNVQPGTAYPSTLIACTDADMRWPGQARKMAAAVQHATSSDQPVLHRRFDINWHGELGAISGENGPDSGDVAAEIVAFIMRELSMKPIV